MWVEEKNQPLNTASHGFRTVLCWRLGLGSDCGVHLELLEKKKAWMKADAIVRIFP